MGTGPDQREGSKEALQMVISPASVLDAVSADSGGKSRLLLERDEREFLRGREKGDLCSISLSFWLGEEGCGTIRGLSGAITHSRLITSD